MLMYYHGFQGYFVRLSQNPGINFCQALWNYAWNCKRDNVHIFIQINSNEKPALNKENAKEMLHIRIKRFNFFLNFWIRSNLPLPSLSSDSTAFGCFPWRPKDNLFCLFFLFAAAITVLKMRYRHCSQLSSFPVFHCLSHDHNVKSVMPSVSP